MPDRTTGYRWNDPLLATACWGSAAVIVAVFGWMMSDLVIGGLSQISFEFLTSPVLDAGRGGGIGPLLLSTMAILAVCLAVAIPLGLATAVLLSEYARQDSRFTSAIRVSLDVLAGMPSIVFGLFGNALFCIVLGMGFSILSGGLTLACMVLPLLIRTTEESLRAVPDDYRHAAAALAISRSRSVLSVLLPAAAPGLLVGIVLGTGRALAETAALIFTSGYVTRSPESLFDSGRSLSVHIYDLAMNVPGGEARAYATAVVLVVLLFGINLGASLLLGRWQRRLQAGGPA